MGQKYEAVIPFVTVIEDDRGAAEMFKECLEQGAKGLKLIGWHSNYIKMFDYDLRLPSLMQVFRLAEEWEVPVLVHLWLGYSKTTRDYVQDLDGILTEFPRLRFVLAHFGLGFDPDTLPLVTALAERHRNLYFDTSLYGSFCEVWFSRASNQSSPLRDLVCRFPRQILFGTDVFGSRVKQAKEYHDALRASVGFITKESISCMEFRKTEYFKTQAKDKYGTVVFEPDRIHSLHLGNHEKLLDRIFLQNAKDILKLE
jgi:predicted TIM-barrel fold metal-dependent hydrolase